MSSRQTRRINNLLVVCVLIASVLVTLAFGVNIVSVAAKTTTSSGDTLDVQKGLLKNDQYVIGNNPTDFQKETFQELTNSLKENDPYLISEQVVRNFIADYYTWTNKDGNYEVGGLQYLYGHKFTLFQNKARWEFYKDLDLYISQYGRKELLEVDSIETTPAVDNGNYEVNGEAYPSYYVEAHWTYKNTKLDTSGFQKTGYYTVINRDGRYEIVSMFESWGEPGEGVGE